MWRALGCMSFAGAIGGLVNALLAGSVPLPRFVSDGGMTAWVPGIVGTVIVGAVAATISYGLYGPVAHLPLIGKPNPNPGNPTPLTIAAFVGAILVGYTGGRWIQAEADKTLNHNTAVMTAESLANVATAAPANPATGTVTPDEAKVFGSEILLKLQHGNALETYEAVKRSDPLFNPGPQNL